MKTYYIYTLSNPNNSEVFYVGITTSVEGRRYAHQNEARKMLGRGVFPGMMAKDQYVAYHNIIPVLEVVDTVACDTKYEAEKVEEFWMWQFRSWGFPMMNRYKVFKTQSYNNVTPFIT